MKKLIIALAIIAITTPATAQVYRCIVNGKLVFTDQPCDGSAAPIEIRKKAKVPTRQSTGTIVTSSSRDRRQRPAATYQSTKKLPPISSLEAAYFILDDEVLRLEKKVKALRSQQTSELNRLKRKKRRANNNLAGATWLRSISEEMSAVVSLYNSRIKTAQANVDRKKKDRRMAKDKIKARKTVGY